MTYPGEIQCVLIHLHTFGCTSGRGRLARRAWLDLGVCWVPLAMEVGASLLGARLCLLVCGAVLARLAGANRCPHAPYWGGSEVGVRSVRQVRFRSAPKWAAFVRPKRLWRTRRKTSYFGLRFRTSALVAQATISAPRQAFQHRFHQSRAFCPSGSASFYRS